MSLDGQIVSLDGGVSSLYGGVVGLEGRCSEEREGRGSWI